MEKMDSIEIIAKYAEEAADVVQKDRDNLRDELLSDLKGRYRTLFKIVIGRQLPLGKLEKEDFGREMDRLYDLQQVYLRRSVRQFGDFHARAQPIYDTAIDVVLSIEPYSKWQKIRIRGLLTVRQRSCGHYVGSVIKPYSLFPFLMNVFI
jgi:hypothetical protein